jgi:predicted Zn-dependent peptidase
MTRTALLTYQAQWFTPVGSVVAVASPFPTDFVFEQVERTFGEWTGVAPPSIRPAPGPPTGPIVQTHSRRAEQVRFRLGFAAPSRREPHRHALEVLATTLAGPATSRLELRLREDLGLVYDVSTNLELYEDTGLLSIAAGVAPGRLVAAVEAIVTELRSLKSVITVEEVRRVQDYLAGRWLCAEGTDFHASFAGRDEQVLGQPTTVDEEISRIRGVTCDEVSQLARSIFRADRAVLTICGQFRSSPRIVRLLTELA